MFYHADPQNVSTLTNLVALGQTVGAYRYGVLKLGDAGALSLKMRSVANALKTRPSGRWFTTPNLVVQGQTVRAFLLVSPSNAGIVSK